MCTYFHVAKWVEAGQAPVKAFIDALAHGTNVLQHGNDQEPSSCRLLALHLYSGIFVALLAES